MATAIEIENIGPVAKLSIPVPEHGGLIVLTGDNGAGKSETLGAVRAICGSAVDKKELRPRDGEKSGVVEGCGVTIKVGRSNREMGELTVASLEDRLDIADLVDPGINDLNAADARRLKALIRVSGVMADLQLFDALLPDTVEMDAAVMRDTDLVSMAAGVKRMLEREARKHEQLSEAASLQMIACLKATEGVDLEAECNETQLRSSYATAVQQHQTIVEGIKNAEEDEAIQAKARQALFDASEIYKGPTVEEATRANLEAEVAYTQWQSKVTAAEKALNEAKLSCAQAKSSRDLCAANLNSAIRHSNTLTAWHEQLERPVRTKPTQEQLDEAAKAVEEATARMENGGVVRQAKAKAAEAETWRKRKFEEAKKADNFRESAKSVDNVLSDQIGKLGCPIKVSEDDKGMRLTVNHRTRGVTYFSELSEGEKWAVVIPIAIQAVGNGGLFVIPQEAWEGLQPRVRNQIVTNLKGSGVTAITAQSADGPLTATEVAS